MLILLCICNVHSSELYPRWGRDLEALVDCSLVAFIPEGPWAGGKVHEEAGLSLHRLTVPVVHLRSQFPNNVIVCMHMCLYICPFQTIKTSERCGI